MIKTKSRYSFEDRGTGGQTDRIRNLKKSFSLVCRARQNKSTDIQHIAI